VNDPVFEVGDVVRVLEDNTEVSHLQKDHGEWNEDMAKVSCVSIGICVCVCKVFYVPWWGPVSFLCALQYRA